VNQQFEIFAARGAPKHSPTPITVDDTGLTVLQPLITHRCWQGPGWRSDPGQSLPAGISPGAVLSAGPAGPEQTCGQQHRVVKVRAFSRCASFYDIILAFYASGLLPACTTHCFTETEIIVHQADQRGFSPATCMKGPAACPPLKPCTNTFPALDSPDERASGQGCVGSEF
jgi:hypothetical protein